MTAADVLALYDAAEGWLEALTGAPLEPPERAWIRNRVGEFAAPRLDEPGRMRLWVDQLRHDVETGRAIVVRREDGVEDVWRGEES
jgi:hypothetical protein